METRDAQGVLRAHKTFGSSNRFPCLLSRRDLMKIARRFNAGIGFECNESRRDG